MGSSRHLIMAAAAFSLVVSGAPAWAGQGQADWAGPRLQGPTGEARFKERARSPRRPAAAASTEVKEAAAPPRAEAPPRTEAPAPPPAASVPAAPELADPLPTLPAPRPTDDAPEIPPVISGPGGGPSSGPSPASTPEPTTLLLMGTGLAGLYRLRRKR
jgi:PEP-CTERM motif